MYNEVKDIGKNSKQELADIAFKDE